MTTWIRLSGTRGLHGFTIESERHQRVIWRAASLANHALKLRVKNKIIWCLDLKFSTLLYAVMWHSEVINYCFTFN